MTPTGPRATDSGSSPLADPPCGGFYTARDSRNQRRFHVWLCAAMLAYLGATAAIRWRASLPAALAWVLVGLALVLSIQATRSYLVFLRGVDELLRKIQTESLATGFAAGAALSMLYPLLVGLGAPKLDGEVTAVVMMLSSAAGAWFGTRHYSGRGVA